MLSTQLEHGWRIPQRCFPSLPSSLAATAVQMRPHRGQSTAEERATCASQGGGCWRRARTFAEPSPRGGSKRQPGRGDQFWSQLHPRRLSFTVEACPNGYFATGQVRPPWTRFTFGRVKIAERALANVSGCPTPQSNTLRKFYQKEKIVAIYV